MPCASPEQAAVQPSCLSCAMQQTPMAIYKKEWSSQNPSSLRRVFLPRTHAIAHMLLLCLHLMVNTSTCLLLAADPNPPTHVMYMRFSEIVAGRPPRRHNMDCGKPCGFRPSSCTIMLPTDIPRRRTNSLFLSFELILPARTGALSLSLCPKPPAVSLHISKAPPACADKPQKPCLHPTGARKNHTQTHQNTHTYAHGVTCKTQRVGPSSKASCLSSTPPLHTAASRTDVHPQHPSTYTRIAFPQLSD